MTTPKIIELLAQNQSDLLKKRPITLTLKKGIIDECRQRKRDNKIDISTQVENALIETWQNKEQIPEKTGQVTETMPIQKKE